MKRSRKEILKRIIKKRGIFGTVTMLVMSPFILIFVTLGWCLKGLGEQMMKARYW